MPFQCYKFLLIHTQRPRSLNLIVKHRHRPPVVTSDVYDAQKPKRPSIYSPARLSYQQGNLQSSTVRLLNQMSLVRCIPRTTLVLTQRSIPQRHFHAATKCTMSSTDQPSAPTFKSIGITNTDIRKAAGVQLTPHQEVLVGSVLDLFEGRPSLRHLSLWTPTATFHDPITNAVGFDKFAAQWYGLVALFSPITIQSHEVTSSGDPISLRLSNKYVLKGLGTEKVMDSVVDIHVGPDGRISRVEDKWNDKLPQGPFATAFQKLNAVSVPAFVKVPKTQEEDDQMRADRAREAQT